MVFQTRQLTSSAGDDLVHPARHGLPPSTEVASSSNSRSSEPCSERCSSLDRTWHGLTVRAAARVHRWRQLGPNQPQLCPTTNNFGLENRFNA